MKYKLTVYSCIIAVTFVTLSGCNSGALSTGNNVPAVSRKLGVVSAAYLANEKAGETRGTHGGNVEFARNGSGVAYIEPIDGKYRVVHNGKAGKKYFGVSELIVSSDGKRVAYVGSIEGVSLTVVDGTEGYPFGADDNHWFSADGKRHISTVTQAGSRFLVIDGHLIQKYRLEHGPVLSSDTSNIAFSIKSADGRSKQLVITDLNIKNTKVFDSCGESLFASDDNSSLAVLCVEEGKNHIKAIDLQKRTVFSDSVYDGALTKMKFTRDNSSLLYVYIKNEKQRIVYYNGKEDVMPVGDEVFSDPLVLTDPESVGVIIGDVYKARLYRAFYGQKQSEKKYGYISDFISSKDGRQYAFVAVNNNEEQQYLVVNGNEGVKFDKIVSPLFTPDGRFVVNRARLSGKRYIVVTDLKGKIVRQHKEYDMVFQPTISADGTTVSYGVLDGNELWWKVEKL